MLKERIITEDELDNMLKRNANICSKAYHGADLNGVYCLRLVENPDVIMHEVKQICQRRHSMVHPHI